MDKILRHILLLATLFIATEQTMAQSENCREIHKVKRKETIYSITKEYDITIDELAAANPEILNEGFKLKKGTYLCIPFKGQANTAEDTIEAQQQVVDIVPQPEDPIIKRSDVRQREVRIGVMLPFDKVSDEGKRMTEYYRGVLMACDSLKSDRISTVVNAWNINAKTNINTLLDDPTLQELDLIIGPYHAKHTAAIADFAQKYGIKLLVPYSVNVADSLFGTTTFLSFIDDSTYSKMVAERFVNAFDTCNIVLINSDDTSVRKTLIAKELREKLAAKGISVSETSLAASNEAFATAFSKEKHNVAVLNTGRSQDLNIAFAMLNTMTINHNNIRVTVFGHTEWLAYTSQNLGNYYKYDTYIPSTFFMNPLSPNTARMNIKYRWNFHDDMENTLPRFAMTGFDHTYFFVKGLKKRGIDFKGTAREVDYTPLQTPMNFQPNESGSYSNISFKFIHYTPEYDIETYTY